MREERGYAPLPSFLSLFGSTLSRYFVLSQFRLFPPFFFPYPEHAIGYGRQESCSREKLADSMPSNLRLPFLSVFFENIKNLSVKEEKSQHFSGVTHHLPASEIKGSGPPESDRPERLPIAPCMVGRKKETATDRLLYHPKNENRSDGISSPTGLVILSGQTLIPQSIHPIATPIPA